jgi:hypothetical protein
MACPSCGHIHCCDTCYFGRDADLWNLASPETAEALARALTSAIVDIEEERLPADCIADECSHEDDEHPEPGVHCGDGGRLAAAALAAMRETKGGTDG